MEITEELNTYKKNKQYIYKWRETHKDEYLLKQHNYFKNKLLDPEFKNKHYAKCKEYRDKKKKLKEEEQQKTGIKKKVGRPPKYE